MASEQSGSAGRWRWPAILSIVIGVAAVSFGIHRWIIDQATEEGRPIAEQRATQRAEQQRQAERADTLTSLLTVLEQRLEERPLDSMLVISAANVAYDLGRFDQAERYYRRFIDSIDPANPAPRIDLAYVVFREGRQDEALDLLHDVLQRYPTNQTAMFNMAYILDQLGRTAEATTWMEKCRDANPNSPLGQQATQILTERR